MPLINTLARSSIWLELSNFGVWWIEQLSSLIAQPNITSAKPKTCRIEQGSRSLNLHYHDNELASQWQHDGNLSELSADDWNQLDELTDGERCCWQHNVNDLLPLQLNLPAKAASDIKDAVRYQIIAEAPLIADALDWGYHAIRRDSVLDITIWAAQSQHLDAIDTAFMQNGMRAPQHVFVNEDGHQYLLRDTLSATNWSKTASYVAPFLAIIVALIATIIIANALTSSYRADTALLAEKVRPKLQAEAQVRKIAALNQQIRPVASKLLVTPRLEEIASALPNKAWVEAFGQSSNRTIEMVVVGIDQTELTAVFQDLKTIKVDNIAPQQGPPNTAVDITSQRMIVTGSAQK